VLGIVGHGAAGGQHEEHLVLRGPAKDAVNKTSTEPKAAQSRRITGLVY